jgi:zinc transporter ZupT
MPVAVAGCGGMETLRLILLYAHLVGFAVLLGAAVAQYVVKPVRINAPMIWGAGAQLVTGIALSSPLPRPYELDPAKLIVKLVLASAIFVMVFFSRKREVVSSGHFLAIIGLTLANAAVAVFWR